MPHLDQARRRGRLASGGGGDDSSSVPTVGGEERVRRPVAGLGRLLKGCVRYVWQQRRRT